MPLLNPRWNTGSYVPNFLWTINNNMQRPNRPSHAEWCHINGLPYTKNAAITTSVHMLLIHRILCRLSPNYTCRFLSVPTPSSPWDVDTHSPANQRTFSRTAFCKLVNHKLTSTRIGWIGKNGGNVMSAHLHNIACRIVVSSGGSLQHSHWSACIIAANALISWVRVNWEINKPQGHFINHQLIFLSIGMSVQSCSIWKKMLQPI